MIVNVMVGREVCFDRSSSRWFLEKHQISILGASAIAEFSILFCDHQMHPYLPNYDSGTIFKSVFVEEYGCL